MATVEVFTVGGGEMLVNTFNAIAGWTNSGGYIGLLQVVGVIALGWATASLAMTQDWRSFLRWFLGFIAVYTMMFLPKLDVKVTDSINPALAPATVGNIPIGVALLASFSSQVGDYLTSSAETVFGMPNDMRYRTNGMIYGSRLLEASRVVRISQPEFAANLDEFTRQCIFYDILSGKYSLQNLVDTDDIWGFIGTNSPSPVRMTSVKALGVSPVTTTIQTCADAYTTMSAQWVAANGPIDIIGLKLGRQMYPKLADAAAKTKILSDLPIAHTYILNGTKSASQIFQQTLMINAFNQASHSFAASTSGGALDVLAQTRADIQTERTYQSVARQAEIYVPVLRNVLEVLFYALFPVIFPLFLLPRSGIRTMEGYSTGFFYLQAWGPVYVILHSMMMWQAQGQGNAEARGIGAMSIANAAGIGEINSMTGTLAGYLLMSVPFIAAGLAKGALAISSHAVSFLAPSQHAAEAGAAAATTGSFQLDNTSFGTHAYNTFSANKFNSAADYTAGAAASRQVQSDGSTLTDYGANNSVLDTRGATAHLPFMANISQAMNTEQSRLAASSLQRGESLSNNAETSFSAATSAFTKFLQSTGSSTGTDRSSGFGNTETASSAQSQVQRLSTALQQQFGMSSDAAYRASVETYVSKSLGASLGGGRGGGKKAAAGAKDGVKAGPSLGLNISADSGQRKAENESFGGSASTSDSRGRSFAEDWAENHNWSQESQATFRAMENSSDSNTRALAREVQSGLTQSNQFSAQSREYYEQGHRLEQAMSERASSGASVNSDLTNQMFRYAQGKVAENPAHFANFNPNMGASWLAPASSATGRQRDMLIDAFFNDQIASRAQPALPDANSAVYEGTPLDVHNVPTKNRLVQPRVSSAADVQHLGATGQQAIAARSPEPVSGVTPASIATGRAQVQDEALSGADVHSGVIQQQREGLSRDVIHLDSSPIRTMKNAGYESFGGDPTLASEAQKKSEPAIETPADGYYQIPKAGIPNPMADKFRYLVAPEGEYAFVPAVYTGSAASNSLATPTSYTAALPVMAAAVAPAGGASMQSSPPQRGVLPSKQILPGKVSEQEAINYARHGAVEDWEIKSWPVPMQQALRAARRTNREAGEAPASISSDSGDWHFDRNTGTQFRYGTRETPLADGKPDLIVPQMQRTGDWRRQLPDYAGLAAGGWRDMPKRDLSQVTMVTLHHTGGNTGSAREVENLHMTNGQGWMERAARATGVIADYSSYADIGYAYIVHPNGQVFEGRDIYFNQADVRGRNSQTVGIAFAGVFSEKDVSPAALQSARNLVAGLDHLTGRQLPVYTHGDLDEGKKTEMAGGGATKQSLQDMRFRDLQPPPPAPSPPPVKPRKRR